MTSIKVIVSELTSQAEARQEPPLWYLYS